MFKFTKYTFFFGSQLWQLEKWLAFEKTSPTTRPISISRTPFPPWRMGTLNFAAYL